MNKSFSYGIFYLMFNLVAMFNLIWQCCTPGMRKNSNLTGREIQPRRIKEEKPRPVRSLSTLDIPEICSTSLTIVPLFKPEISLLSYNIFMRPIIPEYQELRIELFTDNVLPEYDIVCLQEMFSAPLSSRRKRFIEQAKCLGFHWFHHSSRSHSLSAIIDGGLVILSRLPIVKTDILNFSSAAFADWYASKGIIYSLIQVASSSYVHVFCTHLQATYDEKGLKISEKVRQDQLKQASEFINVCTEESPQWPIIICGDLNVQCRKSIDDGSDSQEYSAMMLTLRNGLGLKGECIRDLTREIDGKTHPVTYGDSHIDEKGDIHPREVSLTDIDSIKQSSAFCNQSLDKILWIPSTHWPSIVEPKFTAVNPLTIDKETWKGDSEHPLTHLSDHYGVETTLGVNLEN
jgi:endonuclease/exonuclease/phosphatase family metal-dependent hydrolase